MQRRSLLSLAGLIWAVAAVCAAEPTDNLTLSFAQSGEAVEPTRRTDEAGRLIHELTLSAAPFDIRLPDAMWANRRDANRALIIAASVRPDFLQHLRTGVAASDVEFIGPSWFKAMAWDPDEPGDVLTAERPIQGHMDFGNNWIAEHRFVNADAHQVLTIASLTDRDGLAPLLQAGTVVTMVFYLDRALGDPANVASQTLPNYQHDDLIHAEEIDIVRITFESSPH